MRFLKIKGFSLIEIIVAISLSSIIVGSVFFLFNNVKLIENSTNNKSEIALDVSYTYNLLKNDLSNSIPGIINNELSIYLKNEKELRLHRVDYFNTNQTNLIIVGVKWSIIEGKLYRTTKDFGNKKEHNTELMFDFQKEINFKIERKRNLKYFISNKQVSPSIISLVIGNNIGTRFCCNLSKCKASLSFLKVKETF